MSKGRTIKEPTGVEAAVSEADDAVLALARLLGRQAAREMAAHRKSRAGARRQNPQYRLFGELAALISFGIRPDDKHPLADAEGVQVTLVAGAGFEPATFRL